LHENYPQNKAELEGKRGKQKPYKTALEMPGLANKEQRKGATTRSNCIHCHNIHDAEFAEAQSTGKFTEDMLWRYPLPDNLGLIINAKDGRRVDRVLRDSPAAKAGLQPGEDITHINGQAITSIADIQWALNPLPTGGTKVKVTASKTGEHALELAEGWKKTDISWRGSMESVEPKLRVWAPELTEAERRERGLSIEDTALLVKWINTGEPAGRAAQSAGLREGDVIVALDGKPLGDWTNRQFNVHVKLNYKVGETLPLTIRRGKETKTITVKLVE
jgi:S1-C subfamily serine protease